MSNIHPACLPVTDTQFNVLTVKILADGPKFHAKLHISLRMPYTREVNLDGPTRDTRPEAIKDGMELGKRYVVEGEAGAKSVLLRLKKKRWTAKEVADADEKALDGFVLQGLQGNQALKPVEQKLLPPGEGWVRHSEDILVHPQSQVFFAQSGDRAGKYLRRRPAGGADKWEETEAPHTPLEQPLVARAASASWLRRGGKPDRAVLLNDITKIARLALKIPLSFLDKPASAFALFQGHRGSESSQWCAENFHKKLLPRLVEKIHAYSTEELEAILRATLAEMDAELLKSPSAFSGCSALIGLLVGDRFILAGVGQVRAVMLPEKGEPRPLLDCTRSLEGPSERDRLCQAGGSFANGSLVSDASHLDDAGRILSARNAFEVLRIGSEGPSDEKQVRSAYRKLALCVHPDKQSESADLESFKGAFARLESSREALEAMVAEDIQACHELCRVLYSDVHSRAGAAALLGVSKAAASLEADVETVEEEAEKAREQLVQKLAKMRGVSPDYDQAVAACREAVETLRRRACSAEALPRYEALLKEAVATSRAMGLRDLRLPRPLILMEPETAAWQVPLEQCCRVAFLCGATAALGDPRLLEATARHPRHPKACALRWCLDADATAACSSAICLSFGAAKDAAPPPAKKARTAAAVSGPEGTVRIRHILFRHHQLKQPDVGARREGAARNAQEAEEAALKALETLLAAGPQKAQAQFPRLCREQSDCQSAEQPGMLSGDLGWLGRGQQEQIMEDAIFGLAVGEFSDVVTSARGVHIIQRLA